MLPRIYLSIYGYNFYECCFCNTDEIHKSNKTGERGGETGFPNVEAEWDEGGVGEWYKEGHRCHSNRVLDDRFSDVEFDNQGHLKDCCETDVGQCSVERGVGKSFLATFDSDFDIDPDLKAKTNDLDLDVGLKGNVQRFEDETQVKELWDPQYDFNVLDSPKRQRNKGDNSLLKGKSSPGRKVKDAFSKGREFFRSCTRIFRIPGRMKGESVNSTDRKDPVLEKGNFCKAFIREFFLFV